MIETSVLGRYLTAMLNKISPLTLVLFILLVLVRLEVVLNYHHPGGFYEINYSSTLDVMDTKVNICFQPEHKSNLLMTLNVQKITPNLKLTFISKGTHVLLTTLFSCD